MGNASWDLASFPLSKHQWVPTALPNTLASTQDNTLADWQSICTLTHQDIKLYLMRSLNNKYLVNVFAVLDRYGQGKMINRKLKAQQNPDFMVLVQKINYRLPDLGALAYRDAIYMIRQGVKAISCLLQVFDGFLLEEEAIGITDIGQCKYWVNSNYFVNNVQTAIADEPMEYNLEKESKGKCQQQLSTFSLASVCNPEESIEDKLREAERRKRNCERTLKNLMGLIESKMLYRITKEEEMFYMEAKRKYLNEPKDPHINEELHKIQTYSLQNMEKWIEFLCAQANVSDNYKINLPCKTYSQAGKTKLTRVRSNAQFFEANRGKQAHSLISPLKFANFKIIAQAKTSLKKSYKVREECKANSYTNKFKGEDKPSHYCNFKQQSARQSFGVFKAAQNKEDNNYSQITIKSALSNIHVQSQSRWSIKNNRSEFKQEEEKFIGGLQENSKTKRPVAQPQPSAEKIDELQKQEPKKGEGDGSSPVVSTKINSRQDRSTENTTKVGLTQPNNHTAGSWLIREFGVRQLRPTNYNQSITL